MIHPIRTHLASAAAAALTGIAGAQGIPAIPAWDPGSSFAVDANITEALNTGARFGFAVAMTGDYAVVGAPDVRLRDNRFPALNLATNGAGAAFVFKRTAGTNEWAFVQRLIAPTRVLAQTGCSVAIDPVTDDIVVGAWGYDAVAAFGGAAFVYRKGSGDSWGEAASAVSFGTATRVPSQVLAPEELEAIDQFGFAVAIDNGTIAVGCPLSGSTNTGAVYLYELGASEYAFTEKLTDDGAGANDQMGTKLAISGDLLAVGVQNDDVEGRLNAGSVLVYRRESGSWARAARVTAPTPATSAAFGSAVAIVDTADTDWIVVGAPTQASGRTTSVAGNGAAYVLSSIDDGTTWTRDASLLPRTDNINNNFGYAVAVTQDDPPLVLVGAPGFDTAIPSEADPDVLSQVVNGGAGFCFERSAGTWERRGTGPIRGDAWAPAAIAGSNIGRAVALPPGSGTFSIVSADTPTGGLGSVYPFQFRTAQIGTGDDEVSGPASGELDAEGNPSDGSTPGTGTGGTGGGITGGGSPTPGITAGPGAVTLPLTPIIYNWGIVKGSAVSLSGRRVHLLQTDGKHRGQRPEFRYLGDLPEGATYVGSGDMNGDFSGDIVFVAPGEVLRYWKRDAFTVTETATIDTLPAGFDAITVADVDGDSNDDILLQGTVDPSQLRVWGISGGAIASSDEYELPAGDWTVFTGNFRTANATDILLRDRRTGVVRVLVPDGAGGATFPVIASRPATVRLAGFGDIDGNGQPDVFWQGGENEVDLMDQDEDGNYVRIARRRTGFADGNIVNIRDWNDDGTIDFWMRRGNRNYIQYGQVINGYVYGKGSRDLRDVPGTVVSVAER